MTAPDARSWSRVGDLFADALERPPGERNAWLARVCADEPEVRSEVASLLAAHDGPELDIEAGLLGSEPEAQGLAGTPIGPYRLVERLGRGGMGEVWLGRREGDFEQEVAVKILRAPFLSGDLVDRFRQERRILARLDHPGIASLLDGGLTDDGRPYLVMQRVRGAPITEWCDSECLSLDARLRLFRQVATAVHAAHARLVVHRDLKPSNIFVDESGDVRLLDFGIAKLLDPSEEPTVDTRSEMRVLTPEFAAPEQLAGATITTATDVHALGVLLHLLVVGTAPFPAAGRTRAALERSIRETEPPAPSREILVAGRTHQGREALRSRGLGTPARLARRLRGDFDAIVAKSLRKEPGERFASALQLSEEVERFLDGRPVLARKGALAYRMRKLATRNPWATGAILVALSTLGIFLVLLGLQADDLARERDRAESERDTAERMVELLTELLGAADPRQSPLGRDTPIGEIVDARGDRLVDAAADQPRVQARMRQSLAVVHAAFSEFDRARELLDAAIDQQRALTGNEHPDTVTMLAQRARLVAVTGPPEDARRLLRQALELQRRVFGEGDRRTLLTMQDLAGQLDPRSPEARTLLERALEILRGDPARDPETIAPVLARLGLLHFERDELAEAERRWAEATELVEEVWGDDHPNALTLLNNRAALAGRRGHHAEAEALHSRILTARRRAYGERSLEVATDLNNLGVVRVEQQDRRAGLAAFREALDIYREVLGPDHLQVANTLRNLGLTLLRDGRPGEARKHLEDAAATAERSGADRATVAAFESQLAEIDLSEGRPQRAAERLEPLLGELERLLPGGHASLAEARGRLGEVYLELGRPREANPLWTEALAYREEVLPKGHVLTEEARCGRGRALADLGDWSRAAEDLRACVPLLRSVARVDDPAFRSALAALERTERALEVSAE